MMRPPPQLPTMNGRMEYDGEAPEDDYSDFNAWGEDFDDNGDYMDPEEHHPIKTASFGTNMNSMRPVPPPPSSRQQPFSPGDDPPPIVPRGNRPAPAVPTENEQRAPSLPQGRPGRNVPTPPVSDDDDADDYLEPNTQQDSNDGENYEDPEMLQPQRMQHQPPQQPHKMRIPRAPALLQDDNYEEANIPAISPARRLLPAPPSPPDETYEEANTPAPSPDSTETYSELDDHLLTARNVKNQGPPNRRLPPVPQDHGRPNIPVPPPPRQQFEMPEDDYEPPIEPVPPYGYPNGHSAPIVNRSLPPEPVDNSQHMKAHTINKLNQKQPKLLDTMKIKEKKDNLFHVGDIFSNRHAPVNNQPDEPEETVSQVGIKGMIAKLGKSNSLFRQEGNASNHVLPRDLPRAPIEQPPPGRKLSNASIASSASEESSSGSGTFHQRKPDDILPPVPQPQPYQRAAPTVPPAVQKPAYVCKVEDEYWYHDVDRTQTDDLLRGSDGRFLIRPSKLGGAQAPYTMCVYYKNRVWNLKIRLRNDKMFALGTEHESEKTFRNVRELVDYHHHTPITLAGKESGTVILSDSPVRDDIYDATCLS